MSAATTTRPVDIAQLDTEVATAAGLDTPPGLSAATIGDETTVTCAHEAVTDAILAAVLDAHTPQPPPPSEAALLQQQINALTDLILFGF